MRHSAEPLGALDFVVRAAPHEAGGRDTSLAFPLVPKLRLGNPVELVELVGGAHPTRSVGVAQRQEAPIPVENFLWLRHPDTLAKMPSAMVRPSRQECPGHPAPLTSLHART